MTKNAIINSRLYDLLNVLDARATVNIFVVEGETQKSIKYARVLEILTDPDFMRDYKTYEVVGLNIGLVNNILIDKEA